MSGLGQILKSVQETGTVNETEIHDFLGELKKTIESGVNDIVTLVENAPDWFQTAAENTGIDLESAISEFVQNAPAGPNGLYNRPPMPPPPLSQLGDLFKTAQESGNADEEDIKTLIESVQELINSGSADLSTLLETSPEWLKTAAVESGMDLETVLNDFLSGFMDYSNHTA